MSEIRRKGEVVNPYANLFSENAGTVSNEVMGSNKWRMEEAARNKLIWEEDNIEKSKRSGIQVA